MANYEQNCKAGTEMANNKLPVANTTFGALVNIETTKDVPNSGQSTTTAPPPVTLGSQTAST